MALVLYTGDTMLPDLTTEKTENISGDKYVGLSNQGTSVYVYVYLHDRMYIFHPS
jgi:hypothetical protein